MINYEVIANRLRNYGYKGQRIAANKTMIMDILGMLSDEEAYEYQKNLAQTLHKKLEDATLAEQKCRMKAQDLEKKEKSYDMVLECETEEGREKVRLAQFFMDNVNVDSSYDNTAYIKSLGQILGFGQVIAE